MGEQSEPKSSFLRWTLHSVTISRWLMPFLLFLRISTYSLSFRMPGSTQLPAGSYNLSFWQDRSLSSRIIFCSIDHRDRTYDNNWDAHHAPHYTFKLFTEIYIFPITLSCWQFVEILQWCNHFLSALSLVYFRKLISVCSCWQLFWNHPRIIWG